MASRRFPEELFFPQWFAEAFFYYVLLYVKDSGSDRWDTRAPQIKLDNNNADVNRILSTNSYIRRMKAAEDKKREATDE